MSVFAIVGIGWASNVTFALNSDEMAIDSLIEHLAF